MTKGLQFVDAYSSRKQLHEAIRAIATLPSGGVRSKLKEVYQWLSAEDVKAEAEKALKAMSGKDGAKTFVSLK